MDNSAKNKYNGIITTVNGSMYMSRYYMVYSFYLHDMNATFVDFFSRLERINSGKNITKRYADVSPIDIKKLRKLKMIEFLLCFIMTLFFQSRCSVPQTNQLTNKIQFENLIFLRLISRRRISLLKLKIN